MGKVLSVAVPSYNVEQYLERGLDSYADERFSKDLEVLIINDGSTDSTAEIAGRYVRQYPSIFRLINKQNGGHGSAVNTGLAQATGKYFRIIDGDDWIHTDNMMILIERLRETDADMVVDVKREVHMDTGRTKLYPIPDYVDTDRVQRFGMICTRDDIGSYIMIHTLTVKTVILKQEQIRLLEHIFYVDYEYIVKATCACKTVLFLDLEIYQYLVGNVNQSVSARNYVKRISHHEAVVKEMLRFESQSTLTGAKREYLVRKVQLIIHTHYNIALIFNEDRSEGARQAKKFRAYLKRSYPFYYRMTTGRYLQAYFLHLAGVDAKKLDQLKGRND